VAINLSTALFWGGIYLAYVGTRKFFERPVRHVPWLLLMAALLAAQVWYTVQMPDYRVRMALTTGFTGWISGVHAWLILRQRPLGLARAMAAAVLLSLAVQQAIRLVSALDSDPLTDFYARDTWQMLYLTGLSLSVLLFAISAVLMASDRLRQILEDLIRHDSLTHALTRRHFTAACESELERSRRNGRHMALLMMDLDHFKTINDIHGHQTGDAVLVWFVSRARSVLRRADLLGRYGGEEFVALLPETSSAEARVVAERIRAVLRVDAPVSNCTVSIGIAVNGKPEDTVEQLLARADKALYRAKGNGRDRVEFMSDDGTG
jgi:diguanylate cyclase (GGDEF)-like protein